jgi:hypothetical protein
LSFLCVCTGFRRRVEPNIVRICKSFQKFSIISVFRFCPRKEYHISIITNMGQIMSTIAITCLFIVALYWLYKLSMHVRIVRKQSQPNNIRHNSYMAASIDYQDAACSSVKAMRYKRFLVKEVPQLPLPSCTKPRCGCKYVYHKDRRSSVDRRRFESILSDRNMATDQADRRGADQGRRKTDLTVHIEFAN